MRKILFVFAFTSVIIIFQHTKLHAQKPSNLKGEISLSGAFALYPMTVKWAEEFKKLHPNVKIDISAGGAGKGITDALAKMVDLGMVSRDVNPEEVKKNAYAIAVTKDAVVATVNSANPAIKDLLSKGLSKNAAIETWITGNYKTWGQLLGNSNAIGIHVYTRSDACGAGEVWGKYLGGKKQDDLLGTGVFGDPGVASAVKNDPLGIGYNNIGYAYDSKSKKPNPGIVVVPIDLNGNGHIDPEEKFYGTLDEITAAIADGRYPSPPARDLYFVSNGKPQKDVVVAFIKWVLTDGQKYVHETGFINLSKEKLESELQKVK